MKISDMINNLQKFMEENGDVACYYAVDDEGNGYCPIYFEPTKYYLNEDNEVVHKQDVEADIEFYGNSIDDYTPICVVN